MTDDPRREEHLTAAEQRLLRLLELLRTDAVRSDPALTEAVVRTARWQLVARRFLLAVGGAASLAVEVVGSLLRGPSTTRQK